MNFKKITAIGTSVLIAGMTMGLAAAAYPAPYVESGAGNFAVVYGAGAAVSDSTAAGTIVTELQKYTTSGSTVSAGTIKLTDDKAELGALITTDDIAATILDNKLSGLRDEKFSWNDGSGSDEYDFHEEITVGTMKVLTTLDDEKLTGVALSNEKALEYKFVFEDPFNHTAVGYTDADTLYLEIMGTEYEIEAVTVADNSITVTTSKEMDMKIGDTYTVEGKTVKVEDIFSGSVKVSVDGTTELISTDATKRINGIRVHVEGLGYHTNTPETSSALLKIGKDISKIYTSGEEFVGQDEDDPLWVWDISFTDNAGVTTANDYIGVKYNAKIDSANDEVAGDSIKYVGNGYVFPNNYAAVTLDSITDAKYQDIKIYFDESLDLFNNSDTSTALIENAKVLVIEAEGDETLTVNSIDTDTVYVYYNTTVDKFQTFYRDVAGDYTPIAKPRLANAAATGAVAGNATNANVSVSELATIEIGDTNLDIDLSVVSAVAHLAITNDDYSAQTSVVNLTLGGDAITDAASGTLERFGATAEDAEAGDVKFNGTEVSLKDYDYMDAYGVKLSDGTTVQAEADDDTITLSIPEEQVYAKVTVSMGDVATEEEATVGKLLIKDDEVAGFKTKNLIVVGGSCINSVAEKLVGGKYCGADWTTNTGVASGQYVIKSYTNADLTSGKAVLVAGYEAADTTAAVAKFIATKGVEGTFTTYVTQQ
ncbi:MAG TPA: hypothetical protein PLK34_02725 [Candidatus Pacearchaeota archaeon]|nr:hypothetical protein [Candidatus Pacearchaeota archaeon]